MREIKHLSVHQWLRSAIPDSQQPTSPIGFLFLKLPPPPCAVLLVCIHMRMLSITVHVLTWPEISCRDFAEMSGEVGESIGNLTKAAGHTNQPGYRVYYPATNN